MASWSKNNTGKPVTTDIVRSSVGVIAERIDNLEKGLDGTDSLSNISITGGEIDGTVIGGTTPVAGNFTQCTTDNIRVDGNTISSTDTDGNIAIQPNGEGRVILGATIAGYGSLKSLARTTTGTSTYTSSTAEPHDLMVSGYTRFFSPSSLAAHHVQCKTDSASTPTTIIQFISEPHIGNREVYYSFSFFVKKGDYYSVSATLTELNGDSEIDVYFRECAIGG